MDAPNPFQLTMYAVHDGALKMRAAPRTRQWMDNTRDKFAYHCLPLVAANMHGWELLSPCDFHASWYGDSGLTGVQVRPTGPSHWMDPVSHFGHGILTFHTGYVPRTAPGYNLYATAPLNHPKHGIAALSGLMETDHLSASFTMNWIFTTTGSVHFEKDEPIATLFVVPRELNDFITPRVEPLSADPELAQKYAAWGQSRDQFNAAKTGGRQLDYTRSAHQRRIDCPQPIDYRTQRDGTD